MMSFNFISRFSRLLIVKLQYNPKYDGNKFPLKKYSYFLDEKLK